MPDWTSEVRKRLSSLRLSPAREAEIVEELSQHLEESYALLAPHFKAIDTALS